jgi:hypothetical protein
MMATFRIIAASVIGLLIIAFLADNLHLIEIRIAAVRTPVRVAFLMLSCFLAGMATAYFSQLLRHWRQERMAKRAGQPGAQFEPE